MYAARVYSATDSTAFVPAPVPTHASRSPNLRDGRLPAMQQNDDIVPHHVPPAGSLSQAPASGPPSAEERNWSVLAHLSPLLAWAVGGWLINLLGPLVIWLIKRDVAPFAGEAAREALNFQISISIYAVAALVVTGAIALATFGLGLLIVIPVLVIAGIFAVVLSLVAAVRVSRGEQYRYPLTLRLVS